MVVDIDLPAVKTFRIFYTTKNCFHVEDGCDVFIDFTFLAVIIITADFEDFEQT